MAAEYGAKAAVVLGLTFLWGTLNIAYGDSVSPVVIKAGCSDAYFLSMDYSKDGKLLAVSYCNNIYIHATSSGKLLRKLTGHEDQVESVVFSPDGKHLASGSWDKTIRIWDKDTGKTLHTFKPPNQGGFESVAYSSDGKYLASGGRGQDANCIWDAATGKMLHTFAYDGNSASVAYSPDGKHLASGGDQDDVRVFEAATGKLLHTLDYTKDKNTCAVAYSPDGKYLASGGGWDNSIHIWDPATFKSLHTLRGHTDNVESVAYSPDGKHLASGSDDKTIRIWDAATGKSLRTLEGHKDWVWHVAYSPDGKQLASVSSDKTIRIWDASPHAENSTEPTRNATRNLVVGRSFSDLALAAAVDTGLVPEEMATTINGSQRRTAPSPCLCLFDVDRTLTGKQNDTHHCHDNKVIASIHDPAYGGGLFTVSQLAQNLYKTFCVSCYAGIISHGNAGGHNSQMRSSLVKLLNKNKPSHLRVQNTWVEPGAKDSVKGPLVLSVVNSHKHHIASSIRGWYKSHMKVNIAAKQTHFFDDDAANVETFKGFDYNAYQVSCKSRDSTKNDAIGWCGGTAAECVSGSGVHVCPKSTGNASAVGGLASMEVMV